MELLHPKIVHLPIALAVLMPLVTGGLALAWWRGWFQRRTWWIAVALQAVLVTSAFAAMQTGEADEDRVEAVVAEQFIEAHEEAAEVFMWGSVAVLALVVLPGLIRKEKAARRLSMLAIAGTVATLALGVQVGGAGGDLVYKHGAASAFTEGAASPAPVTRPRHDDDDDD